jgi:hypothetical protein
MTRKRIALEHPVERGVDLLFGNFPRDQGAFSQVGRKQSLPDAPDRPRAQHRGDARHHNLDTYTRAIRDLFERLANEPFDLVFRNGENFCVDRIVMLNRQHTN